MGNTKIDYTLAARIAQAADVTTDQLGSVIIDNREVLAAQDPHVAQKVDEGAYEELGLDLGPAQVLTVEGKKVHAWTQATTAFAA